MGARYYNPQTGTFQQEDPAGEGTNLYQYAGSDPIDFNDPTGMTAFRAIGSAVSAIGSAASWVANGGIDRSMRAFTHEAIADTAVTSAYRGWDTVNSDTQDKFHGNPDLYASHQLASSLMRGGYQDEGVDVINDAWLAAHEAAQIRASNAAAAASFKVNTYGRFVDTMYAFSVDSIQHLEAIQSLGVSTLAPGQPQADRVPFSDYSAHTSGWHNDVGAERLVPIYGAGKQAYYDFQWAGTAWNKGDYFGAAMDSVQGLSNVANVVSDTIAVGSLLRAGIKWATRAPAAVEKAATNGGVSLADDLSGAAARARNTVGPGRGGVYGTRVHRAFEAEVNGLGRDIQTEVSYLNGRVVRRGTPGSVRLDVVNGPLDAPTSVFDLKTGSATLTPGRIQQIQSHVPGGSGVPVFEVRP
jgi:hypothetical protein